MELQNGKYTLGGLDIAEIIKEFGSPLYAYDGNKIVSQLQNLKNAFSDSQLKIKYAVKALSNISILKLLKQHGAGVDVVSIQEARLALLAGYKPEEIMFTPNSVGFDEIIEGVELGLSINIDNLSILEKFGAKYKDTKPVCIRLNPHILAGGNYKISTGHGASKFGISVYQLNQIIETINQWKIQVHGLHIHTGSEIVETDVFLKMAEILFGVAKEFPSLKFLDFGSGFKVAYKEDDLTTNIYDLGLQLGKAFHDFNTSYGKKLELWIEPGKFLVSEAGYLIVKANVIKNSPSSVFVGVNSGLNHLLRPMMYDAYHHIKNISNPAGPLKVYTVVGYICETDTFGVDRKLNEVRENDLLAIHNAGAYGFSMASNYNSRPRPAEVLIWNGKANLIRRAETLDDVLKTQIDIWS
ncbi:MAG TPA: diaminopimelate decarboxylase [Cyclobacteriaceae bacterium]|nr:diaminopimelate decarboxylase [Cyclobacteriaceae bacterium]